MCLLSQGPMFPRFTRNIMEPWQTVLCFLPISTYLFSKIYIARYRNTSRGPMFPSSWYNCSVRFQCFQSLGRSFDSDVCSQDIELNVEIRTLLSLELGNIGPLELSQQGLMLTLDLGSLEPWEHWTLVTQNLGHKGSWEHRLAGFNTDHFHQITDRLVAIITFCSWSVIKQSVLIVPSYAERHSSDGSLQNRPVLTAPPCSAVCPRWHGWDNPAETWGQSQVKQLESGQWFYLDGRETWTQADRWCSNITSPSLFLLFPHSSHVRVWKPVSKWLQENRRKRVGGLWRRYVWAATMWNWVSSCFYTGQQASHQCCRPFCG